MNTKRTSRNNGFSLIEIILALLVMAIGIMALLSLFPSGLQFSRLSHEQTRLAQGAETILNAVEAELRMDPRLWQKGWGGTTTRRWPDGSAQSVSNTVWNPNLYNNYYNWHLHTFEHAVSGFNLWDEENTGPNGAPTMAPQAVNPRDASAFFGGTYNSWFTNKFTLRHHNNLIDVGYRYVLTFSNPEANHDLVELLNAPEGQRLYNPSPASGWQSANPVTPGEKPPPDGKGLPPYVNDFFCVLHTGREEYRALSSKMYRVHLRMVPGHFGISRPDSLDFATDTGTGGRDYSIVQHRNHRDFHRYYYDFNNGYDLFMQQRQ